MTLMEFLVLLRIDYSGRYGHYDMSKCFCLPQAAINIVITGLYRRGMIENRWGRPRLTGKGHQALRNAFKNWGPFAFKRSGISEEDVALEVLGEESG